MGLNLPERKLIFINIKGNLDQLFGIRMQVIFEFARLRAKDPLDVISMNLGRFARRTEMEEQFETRRIAVLLRPSRFLETNSQGAEFPYRRSDSIR
jgi:hypothetical protein